MIDTIWMEHEEHGVRGLALFPSKPTIFPHIYTGEGHLPWGVWYLDPRGNFLTRLDTNNTTRVLRDGWWGATWEGSGRFETREEAFNYRDELLDIFEQGYWGVLA